MLGETRLQEWLSSVKARALTGNRSEMQKLNSNLKADKPKLRHRAVQSAMGRGVAVGVGARDIQQARAFPSSYQ